MLIFSMRHENEAFLAEALARGRSLLTGVASAAIDTRHENPRMSPRDREMWPKIITKNKTTMKVVYSRSEKNSRLY